MVTLFDRDPFNLHTSRHDFLVEPIVIFEQHKPVFRAVKVSIGGSFGSA
jgi:hypothetical protein